MPKCQGDVSLCGKLFNCSTPFGGQSNITHIITEANSRPRSRFVVP
jgi:hypothetical protein